MSDQERIYGGIARSLREFGYSDVTAAMVADVHAAMKAGEPLPHGIIGMFAQKQLADIDALIVEQP